MTADPPWTDATTLHEVRPAVRDLLLSTPAFAELSPEQQQRLAREMVKVSSYLANPDGVGAEPALARAQAGGADQARERATEDRGLVGEDFRAGGVREGVEQFGALVRKVDFPKFVSGLIQGVFSAIVDSSIRQMEAYAELLANVAKTVDQFAQDNITDNNARDYLVQRFPGRLGIGDAARAEGFAEGDPAPPTPRVVATGEDPAADARRISQELNLPRPITDLSDEAQEAELVRQAKLQMARNRQQLLASMVILGINRIVVTDGLINAKVLFDMRASDRARRTASASMNDTQQEASRAATSVGYGSWFSPVSASASAETSSEHVATVESSVDETSESKAEVKAKLSGEVRVNFKSDYFPMEKLATPQMIAAIQGNSTPSATPAGSPPPPAPATA
jgi:hypothetical protein